jgi:hypothetical protein
MNQDDEIWKNIPGYERQYQVSTHGNIRSLDRRVAYYREKMDDFVLHLHRGQELLGRIDKDGYLRVILNASGKMKNYYVHRLIAMTFIPNSDCCPTVDHIDRNRTNNHISNLRWATYKQQRVNATHSYISYEPTRKGPSKWRFVFKRNGIYCYFRTREDAEKFRDEYFKKIGFQMLPD